MADDPAQTDAESAVARWSRRKRESEDIDQAPIDSELDSEPQAAQVATDDDTEFAEQDDVVAALPPIESLTAESDFTPFLDRAVPAELRKLALRKLWLSDPVFANLDGLNDYDDDFRTMGVGKIVRTAYQVGKGMVTKAEQMAEKAAAPSPATDASEPDHVSVADENANDDANDDDGVAEPPTET